jgi:hypothetical protein
MDKLENSFKEMQKQIGKINYKEPEFFVYNHIMFSKNKEPCYCDGSEVDPDHLSITLDSLQKLITETK